MGIRALARKNGVHRRMVREALTSAWPKERKRMPPTRSRLDAFNPAIDQMLWADLDAPRKQVNELVEAADERIVKKTITRYGRVDLLCIDELGYLELDKRGTDLLFQILADREETAIAVASNESFGKVHMFARMCVRQHRNCTGPACSEFGEYGDALMPDSFAPSDELLSRSERGDLERVSRG
ncbi:ATP-binding protein [Actinomadura opuntiae]|uniref:ATP-binding protein n=1 Tax=Actinomadura sp. OS1-43 TaxID=604315 RepID=UPI00255B0352|nr:ATP-binding protein [Actinomadura sp. OS1-43]MDL4819313.1 ATP-binding protein [Actinomadura sp. OS1-43]